MSLTEVLETPDDYELVEVYLDKTSGKLILDTTYTQSIEFVGYMLRRK